MYEWKEISITDMKGFSIGHAQDEAHATGCTVILPMQDKFTALD